MHGHGDRHVKEWEFPKKITKKRRGMQVIRLGSRVRYAREH